jgi:hypothetical protein
MQQITFGQGGDNDVIASTTSDAAKISIEATVYYTYQPQNLPKVNFMF